MMIYNYNPSYAEGVGRMIAVQDWPRQNYKTLFEK
jgi:hypothetical protein